VAIMRHELELTGYPD